MNQQFVKEEQLDSDEKDSELCDNGMRQGIWSDDELLKFMVFTYFNKEIMCSKLQRRTLKIFKQMARFIDSRNSIQCRSQNQKMIKKYKSINKILKVFIQKCGKEQFNKRCLSYSKNPDVKYIINEQPPKQKAGHAVSISTQTDFSSSSEEISQKQQDRSYEKPEINYPFQGGDMTKYYYGSMM